jgi:DNA-binding NarL/FixJ family response regulator
MFKLRWGGFSASSTRVLVVEDFQPFREFLIATLQNGPELQVIAEVVDGLEAVQKSEELQPDLILLDIGLPKLSGIEAARQIRQCAPKSKILFVSQETSAAVVQGALATGAHGYVVKADACDELLTAANAVLGGERFIGKRFAGHDFE